MPLLRHVLICLFLMPSFCASIFAQAPNFAETKKRAEAGNAEAQYSLANIYSEGKSVPQNYAEAVKWYRKAADRGLATAQHSLGLMYEEGRGVAQDHSEAVKWYRKAADQGYTDPRGVLYNAITQRASAENNKVATLQLLNGWDRLAETTKNLNVRDMTIILRAAGSKENIDLSQKDIYLYDRVRYLMGINDAIKTLPIKGKVKSKSLCANPSFPSHSFYLHNYDIEPIPLDWKYNTCAFMGSTCYDQYIRAREVNLDKTDKVVEYLNKNLKESPVRHYFNSLHIITDARQQIVGLGFSCSTPTRSCFVGSTFWHAFDFMSMREKAITNAAIRHDYFQKNQVIHVYSQFGKAVYDWVNPKQSLILGTDDDLLCWSQYLCVFFIPTPIADIILSKSKGVPKNYAEAVKWYRNAAEQGDAEAQYNLGVMYAEGKGVTPNHLEAYAWLNLAATSIKDAKEQREKVGKSLTSELMVRAQKRSTELYNEIEARKKAAGK